ncbi:hypothetical protein Cgig2_015612 [Carnegiea gigantea]|uniref:Uncharacterized protein n=1 Tax=Carnegiea gigantea TaxID=171969 RepID=A0A9Q1GQK0_9CARY|nr:hypothetical protein Cgig2_015612 [Carnegiea gigantea]
MVGIELRFLATPQKNKSKKCDKHMIQQGMNQDKIHACEYRELAQNSLGAVIGGTKPRDCRITSGATIEVWTSYGNLGERQGFQYGRLLQQVCWKRRPSGAIYGKGTTLRFFIPEDGNSEDMEPRVLQIIRLPDIKVLDHLILVQVYLLHYQMKA